jgi:hypothetical protein
MSDEKIYQTAKQVLADTAEGENMYYISIKIVRIARERAKTLMKMIEQNMKVT